MIDIALRSSGTSFNLPQCNNKLYNDRSSIDVFFAIAIDMFCCVLQFVFRTFIPLYHTVILSALIGRRLSDLINDVMLCCVILCQFPTSRSRRSLVI